MDKDKSWNDINVFCSLKANYVGNLPEDDSDHLFLSCSIATKSYELYVVINMIS